MSCCRRHPTRFFIKRVCNNDFGVFRKSPEAKFRSGSLEKPTGSHIGHPKSILSNKKTKFKKSQKSQKSKIFKIGPRIHNSARNLFRMIPQAYITHFQPVSAKSRAKIRQESPIIYSPSGYLALFFKAVFPVFQKNQNGAIF